MRMKIADVVVALDGRRKLRDVRALADSIREIGLQHPITITADKRLVAGLHRLEACKLLGWSEIDATVVRLDALRTELAEIDENLVRNELTELERCDALARRKEIYEALHPETVHGAAGGHAKAARAKATVTDPVTARPSFVADTAAKTGRSASAIYTDVRVAKSIGEDTRRVIGDAPVATKRRELEALAKVPAERQKRVAELVVSNGLPVAVADRVARGDAPESKAPPAPTATKAGGAAPVDDADVADVVRLVFGMYRTKAREFLSAARGALDAAKELRRHAPVGNPSTTLARLSEAVAAAQRLVAMAEEATPAEVCTKCGGKKPFCSGRFKCGGWSSEASRRAS